MECEARQIGDQVATSRGERPLYTELDDYLKETSRGAYGKSDSSLLFYNLQQKTEFSTDQNFPANLFRRQH